MIVLIIIFLLIFIPLYFKNNKEEFYNYNTRFKKLEKTVGELESRNMKLCNMKKKSRIEIEKDKIKTSCKKNNNCQNLSEPGGLDNMLDALHDKIDLMNFDIYMNGKAKREKREEIRQNRVAAKKAADIKKENKEEGASRAASKLSSQSNLSEKQMKAKMMSGKNAELDKNDVKPQPVTAADLNQGKRNLAQLDKPPDKNKGKVEQKGLTKLGKDVKKTKSNKKGLDSDEQDEMNDIISSPPKSDQLDI